MYHFYCIFQSPNPTHHRTKSSPESLLGINGGEASKRLIASESMNDLSRPDGWDGCVTPPGTPPPPYPSPQCVRKDRNSNNTDGEADIFEEVIFFFVFTLIFFVYVFLFV